MTNRIILSYFILLVAFSCTRPSDPFEPQIDCVLQDQYLLQLPSSAPPLSSEEAHETWSTEYRIAKGFAKELDLYQTSVSCKRTLFLLPEDRIQRKIELDYDILLCYYIAKRYDEATAFFEHSSLRTLDVTHPLTKDCLTILFDSYTHTKNTLRADQLLLHMASLSQDDAKRLLLSRALEQGDIPTLQMFSEQDSYIPVRTLLQDYDHYKKSSKTAQMLNAILPGAGYLYLGQKQSAMTAFLLNGLFIGAACYFFFHENIPAGIIFTSFEAGWYFGGITGARQEANLYNERIYEMLASPMMNQEKLFPILSLRYAF